MKALVTLVQFYPGIEDVKRQNELEVGGRVKPSLTRPYLPAQLVPGVQLPIYPFSLTIHSTHM